MSYHAANRFRQVNYRMNQADQLDPPGNSGLERRMDDVFGSGSKARYPDTTGPDEVLPTPSLLRY